MSRAGLDQSEERGEALIAGSLYPEKLVPTAMAADAWHGKGREKSAEWPRGA